MEEYVHKAFMLSSLCTVQRERERERGSGRKRTWGRNYKGGRASLGTGKSTDETYIREVCVSIVSPR